MLFERPPVHVYSLSIKTAHMFFEISSLPEDSFWMKQTVVVHLICCVYMTLTLFCISQTSTNSYVYTGCLSGRMFRIHLGCFICQIMHLVIAFVSNTMFFKLLKYEMSRTRAVITTPAESVFELHGCSNISIRWTISSL